MAAQILVVDDERDFEALIRRGFRREIKDGRYAFSFAYDGLEALSQIESREQAFDVILCDIRMPRMDGLALLRKLHATVPLLRAVMVSAYGDLANIRSAMNSGAFDFVTKPIDFDDLTATIEKTLKDIELLRRAFRERAAAQRDRANLARYFPPQLVDRLANDDERSHDVGRGNVAALFADIVGFTRMSESLTPDEVLELLRAFHARMEHAVFEFDGMLEKFIGDALFAAFGAPETGSRDSTNALACAHAMLKGLDEFNRARASRGETPLRMGVGIHYGPVVMGDIGTDRNAAYAVVGDTVNTASRLQQLCRSRKSDIIVSDALIEAVQREGANDADLLIEGFVRRNPQRIRGRETKVALWTYSAADRAATDDLDHGAPVT